MTAPSLGRDRSGRQRDIRTLPLISSTPDDWDWRGWAAASNIDFADLRIAYRFDTECAAIAACRAGLGVALLSTTLRPPELDSGLVIPFGAFSQFRFGIYWLTTAPRLRRPAQIFANWLLKAVTDARATVVPARNDARASSLSAS